MTEVPGVWYNLCVLHYKVCCIVHDVELLVTILNRKLLACQPYPSIIGRNVSQHYISKVLPLCAASQRYQHLCRKHNSTIASNVLHICCICNSLFWKVRYSYYCSPQILVTILSINSHMVTHAPLHQVVTNLDSSNNSIK